MGLGLKMMRQIGTEQTYGCSIYQEVMRERIIFKKLQPPRKIRDKKKKRKEKEKERPKTKFDESNSENSRLFKMFF